MIRSESMPRFLALVLALPLAGQQVPDSVTFEKDVPYATMHGEKLAMDVARPKTQGAHPAVVLVHGGGFRRGNRQSYDAQAIRLAEHGYVAATVSYRFTPKFQFPAPVHDVKTAVRFLRANASRFSIDPAHIGAWGGSAGGHLVLFLGLTGGVDEFEGEGPFRDQSSRVQAVIDYYGPTDFTRIYDKGGDAAEVLPLFLGGDIKHAMAAHIKASPLNWVSPDDAPVLAVHGTKDPLVPYEQSVWLMERLIAAGVPAELETLTEAGHGFKGADAERAERQAIAFLDKHLRPASSGRRILISNHGIAAQVALVDWPSGNVLWSVPNERGHDAQLLPNGNVLLTRDPKGIVVEIDKEKREVWSYGPAQGLVRPVSAQRLPNGNTLIGDMGPGRVIEVDPQGKTVWKYENPDLGNNRMRLSRRTPSGTTLIAIEAAGKIIEVDTSGKIIWTFEVEGGAPRRPYMAIRLANGNTMVSATEPGELMEVDRNGKVIRSIGRDSRVKMGWTSGFDLVPGGGFLISDYTGRRILEVDASGKTIHEVRNNTWACASVQMAP